MAATYAPVNTVAWYNDPEFVAARNRTIPPGGANSYGKTLYSCSLSSTTKKTNGITDETPPIGPVPWDKTDFIFGQATWSSRHMPNILYRLRPSNDWALFKSTGPPQQKVDAQGQPVYEQWPTNAARPRPLLNFEILPDRIGSEEHWWRFEAWRRLDPRIRWCDISMRMETPYRISDVLLRSRVSRPRPRFNMLSWVQGPRGQTANDVIVRGLTLAQVQANTTRGSTPGLVNPTLGRAGGRIHLLDENSDDDTESSVSGEGDEIEGEGNDDKKREEVTEEESEVTDEEDDGEDTSEGPAPKRRRVGSANEGPTATGPILNHPNAVPTQQDNSVQTPGLTAPMPRMTINSMLNDPNTAPVAANSLVQTPSTATTRPGMTINSMLNNRNTVPMQDDRSVGTSGLTASILERRLLPFPF